MLAARPDFSIERAHGLFTGCTLEKLSQGDLVATLNQLGVSCTSKDTQLIAERFDADYDGKLSFWEF